MNLSKRILAIILAGIPCSVSASHEWSSQQYVTGAGAKTCASFIQQAGPNGIADPASLQWVMGYLAGRATAPNAWHRPFAGPEGIARDVLTYCRAHPASQLGDAAASFFERTRRCRAVRGCR
ncbi:MAG: hypothetical protein LKM31_08545 [Sphingobium sp.]|jgi:hypothetical protein|nr:hypothetical protein [Sphingobium sp.]